MFTTLILLALAGSIMATPPSLRNARSYDQPSTPKPVLNWGDCDPGLVITAQKLGLTTKAFCANMTVPLDYTDTESNRTHTVEVVKVAARVEKPRGSIILNFGGPGGNGVQTLLTSPWYMNATGGEHDLISFEPRGTSQHFLRASCFDSPVERRFSQQSNPARHLLSESKDEKTVTTAWEHAGASAKAFADVCASTLENVGPYLGTAFTARDIMSIVDGLGEEKLNYWGISYGTVLGATLAGMFPGRMGRLVLDAVATPTKYYNSFYGPENYEAIDTLFKAMLEACVKAGPEGCPLASGNSTADALEQQVFDLFDSLKTQPLVWAGELVDFTQPSAGTYLDDTALRGWTISISYNPMNYHILLAAIAGLLDGNVAAAVGARALAESSTEAVQGEALPAIYCSDRLSVRDPRPETARASAAALKNVTKIGSMGIESMQLSTRCAHWKFDAKEHYRGSFDLDTSENPFLILGNTYDPVTPLSSAQRLASNWDGSVLVQLDGFGHGTASHPSKCIEKIVTSYFQDGDLPDADTVCEPDESLADIITSSWQAVKDQI
ncbi:hypothetical protein NM208_g9679 [Fusarium decemcellulare]|uniref:Uncharacterized protein n=2 Tax=Fusarium decemcellulare TaxID=57161 RepID=A0ACC1S0M7_9HYPO|nr:hypothetical protein NM208_g9679 [Fusarium decemcellulare]